MNILDGLVRATSVRSVNRTWHDATGFHVSAAGSTFLNLVVGGVPISATVASSTVIQLSGLGYVVLNAQAPAMNDTQATLGVVAIRVVVTTPTH